MGLFGVTVETFFLIPLSSGAPLSAVLVQLIPPVVSIVSNFVFYSLILYAIGVGINRFFAYTATKSTAVSKVETGNVTRSAVQNSVTRSSTMDINQAESDVLHNAGKDAMLKPTAEEESAVSQEPVEDPAIEPTTAVSNGQAKEENEEITSEETSRKK